MGRFLWFGRFAFSNLAPACRLPNPQKASLGGRPGIARRKLIPASPTATGPWASPSACGRAWPSPWRRRRGSCSKALGASSLRRAPQTGQAPRYAFSTKIKGNHHLQGNVQVYNVRIPAGSHGWSSYPAKRAPSKRKQTVRERRAGGGFCLTGLDTTGSLKSRRRC